MNCDLESDTEDPLPYKIDILAEDLMCVLDALDLLPETHECDWYKRISLEADRAGLDLYLQTQNIKRH